MTIDDLIYMTEEHAITKAWDLRTILPNIPGVLQPEY